jgi:hypothetical protein
MAHEAAASHPVRIGVELDFLSSGESWQEVGESSQRERGANVVTTMTTRTTGMRLRGGARATRSWRQFLTELASHRLQ